jgi:hypothetical protein
MAPEGMEVIKQNGPHGAGVKKNAGTGSTFEEKGDGKNGM